MLSILSLVMAGILYRGLSFVPSVQHRTPRFARRTRLSRVGMSTLSPSVDVLENRALGELASNVVQGKVEKVSLVERERERDGTPRVVQSASKYSLRSSIIWRQRSVNSLTVVYVQQHRNPLTLASEQVAPAGAQLKRRRAWDLFFGAPTSSQSAAVLVVNKKSTFTLEDAHVALGIMNDEAAARRLNVQQLLLTTRAGVAPSAEAFLKGAQASLTTTSSSNGEASVFAVLRWEQVQQLAQDGTLARYLATTASRRRDGSSAPTAPSFALPAWLLEERKRGMDAVFDLHSPFEPAGDQPDAIQALSRGLEEGKRHQTLLGATGTVRRTECKHVHVRFTPPSHRLRLIARRMAFILRPFLPARLAT